MLPQDAESLSRPMAASQGSDLLLDFFTSRVPREGAKGSRGLPRAVLVETLPDEGNGMALSLVSQDCACE